MSKKAVIFPKRKWCVLNNNYSSEHAFCYFKSRSEARKAAYGGTIRKVTKIVYHYE